MREKSFRTVTDPLAVGPSALAVNPTTNKIYVANSGSNNVTVINDGFDVVPGLNVSPSSLSFGDQPIGSTSTETLTLTNGGSTSISGISLTVFFSV
jgi:DNA-binding beta-propeller fold protein YncE